MVVVLVSNSALHPYHLVYCVTADVLCFLLLLKRFSITSLDLPLLDLNAPAFDFALLLVVMVVVCDKMMSNQTNFTCLSFTILWVLSLVKTTSVPTFNDNENYGGVAV
jgi:hypothetical protein